MKAAYIEETGPAESIVYGDLPKPTATGKQVLVKVGAVALNPIDTYIRGGLVAIDLPRPFILGADVAGTVEEVGPQVTRFKIGDRVWGSNQGAHGRQGTFAEFAAIDEDWLYPTPQNISDEDAAAIALVGITAHLGIIGRANLQPGQTVLVIGGTGGVGSAVLQMAKATGATVITTGSTDAKVEACLAMGADFAINYKTEDLASKLKEFIPNGVDVFFETRRDTDFDLAVDLLAPKGCMVILAGRAARPELPVGPFYVKNLTLYGYIMFMADSDQQRACANDINTWLSQGKLKPKIDRILPLSQAAEAHKLQEENTINLAGSLAGKIVLKPD